MNLRDFTKGVIMKHEQSDGRQPCPVVEPVTEEAMQALGDEPVTEEAMQALGDELNRRLEEVSKSIETIDHPLHYGGADNPYEAIKVIEAWGLDFSTGNAVKYIARAGKKGPTLEDYKKARWYLDRKIQQMEKGLAEK